MGRLQGRVALITGAASGIGAATAARFLAEGARVIAADLSPSGEASDDFLPLQLDVTEAQGWTRAVEATEQTFGKLDLLVNNAGIGVPGPIETLPLEDWRKVTAVNLDGVFLGIRAAIPAMRRAGGGAIVNVASMLGSIATVNASAYCASKTAVLGLTRAAALELAAENIRVTAVQPGYVETPLLAASLRRDPPRKDRLLAATPAGRLGTPEEVAAAILYLASDEAGFATGSALVLDGGFTAL